MPFPVLTRKLEPVAKCDLFVGEPVGFFFLTHHCFDSNMDVSSLLLSAMCYIKRLNLSYIRAAARESVVKDTATRERQTGEFL